MFHLLYLFWCCGGALIKISKKLYTSTNIILEKYRDLLFQLISIRLKEKEKNAVKLEAKAIGNVKNDRFYLFVSDKFKSIFALIQHSENTKFLIK